MARMTAKGHVVKDVISPSLSRLLRDLQRGKNLIRGALSVAPGHEYWWFLEFGTGPFHQASDGDLRPPTRVRRYGSKGSPYAINVKSDSPKALLVYMTKYGQRRRAKGVLHPGITPRAFVRISIHRAVLDLQQNLKRTIQRRAKSKLPWLTRKDLVTLVNQHLTELLLDLRAKTPDDQDIDPYHEHRPHTPTLADSWQITKAK